jgi:acyl-CoA thioesterase-1
MALLLAACGRGRTGGPADRPSRRAAPEESLAPRSRPVAPEGRAVAEPPSRPLASLGAGSAVESPTIVFLGTSLTAGLGLDPDSAYPAVLQRKLDSAGLRYSVVNAGVSGESSAGTLRRIDWILRQPPAILVIESGANDALRGQEPDSIRANLQAMIDRTRARAQGARIILAGMEAMPNLGSRYVRKFRDIFPALARANHVELIPFLLAEVGGIDSLNQQDGIHPNEAGARVVADNVWKVLVPLLR